VLQGADPWASSARPTPTRDLEDAIEDLTELGGTDVAYHPALTSSAAGRSPVRRGDWLDSDNCR